MSPLEREHEHHGKPHLKIKDLGVHVKFLGCNSVSHPRSFDIFDVFSQSMHFWCSIPFGKFLLARIYNIYAYFPKYINA